MPAHTAATRKSAAADGLSPNMVLAVPEAAVGPVQVRFELQSRPSLAQPLGVELAIVPTAGIDRISGEVRTGEGLALVEGAQIAPTDHPAEGVPIRHTFTVLPKETGIFTVHAVVTTQSAGRASNATFSFPVIVAAEAAGQRPAGAEALHPAAQGSAARHGAAQ